MGGTVKNVNFVLSLVAFEWFYMYGFRSIDKLEGKMLQICYFEGAMLCVPYSVVYTLNLTVNWGQLRRFSLGRQGRLKILGLYSIYICAIKQRRGGKTSQL